MANRAQGGLKLAALCSMTPCKETKRERLQMKLVRFGAIGSEKPGLIDKAGKLRDLSAHVKDLAGEAFSPANLAKLAALDPASLPEVAGSPRLGSAVCGSPQILAPRPEYTHHPAE